MTLDLQGHESEPHVGCRDDLKKNLRKKNTPAWGGVGADRF